MMAAVTLMPEFPPEMAVNMMSDGTSDAINGTGATEDGTVDRPKKLPHMPRESIKRSPKDKVSPNAQFLTVTLCIGTTVRTSS